MADNEWRNFLFTNQVHVSVLLFICCCWQPKGQFNVVYLGGGKGGDGDMVDMVSIIQLFMVGNYIVSYYENFITLTIKYEKTAFKILE